MRFFKLKKWFNDKRASARTSLEGHFFPSGKKAIAFDT